MTAIRIALTEPQAREVAVALDSHLITLEDAIQTGDEYAKRRHAVALRAFDRVNAARLAVETGND